MNKKQKLELTWIGKENQHKLISGELDAEDLDSRVPEKVKAQNG